MTDSPIFDKKQTNIAKGVAVLLLLWHHLFYNSSEYYERFKSLYLLSSGEPIECVLSDFYKVCVSIFLVLSGFGLYKSWCAYARRLSVVKLSLLNQMIFVKNHLLKLMFSYWFVYLIFVPIGIFFGSSFWDVYQRNILFGILDFLGLFYLFSTPSMNPTWWFMSIIIVYYLIFPVFVKIIIYSAKLWLFICVVICAAYFLPDLKLNSWMLPFSLGMILSKYYFFEKVALRNQSKTKRFFLSCVAVLALFMVRFLLLKHVVIDTVFAVTIILLCFFFNSCCQCFFGEIGIIQWRNLYVSYVYIQLLFSRFYLWVQIPTGYFFYTDCNMLFDCDRDRAYQEIETL